MIVIPGRYLTLEHRRALARVLTDHPSATTGQVIAIFKARTGRTLSRPTAHKARREGVPESPRRKTFTPAQWAALDLLIRAAGPRPSRTDLAAEFAIREGLSISRSQVSRRIIDHHKLDPLPSGPQPGTVAYRPSTSKRIAEASELRRSRS